MNEISEENVYKAVQDHNKRSGGSRKTHKWFEELDAILGARPATEPLAIYSGGRGSR